MVRPYTFPSVSPGGNIAASQWNAITAAVADIDLTGTTGGSAASGAAYEVLVAASNSPTSWKTAAGPTFTADGVADQVQLNAGLATPDKRSVEFGPGTFVTNDVATYTNHIKHNVFGDSTDGTIIAGAHSGHVLDVLHVFVPVTDPIEEWRVTLSDLSVTNSGGFTPSRGVSAEYCGFFGIERVRAQNCTTGIYGYFFNSNHMNDIDVAHCVNGIHITGGNGEASHLNSLDRYNSRDNRNGLKFTTRAQQWRIIQSGFYGYLDGDNGVVYEAGGVEIDNHVYEDCWWEDGAPGLTSWYGCDIRSGNNITFLRPRIGMSIGDFIRPDTFGGTNVRIIDPVVSSWAVLDNLPPTVEVIFTKSPYNNNSRDSFEAVNRFPSRRDEVSRFPVLASRSASLGSISVPGFGASQGDKNLVTSVNLTDTAAWVNINGSLPTSGVTDPNGGTSAFTLATGDVKQHTMVNANGGSAIGGVTFAGIIKAKGALGTQFLLRFYDVANPSLEIVEYINLKDDIWEDIPFVLRSPSGWTGTSLRIRLHCNKGTVSLWNPTIVKGQRVPTYVNAGRDMSIVSAPFTTRGPSLRISTFGTAIPTTGTWNSGDYIENTSSGSPAIAGWHCVVSGTPGQWIPVFVNNSACVNIDRFGAKGDDSTDDTAAWNAAKAAINAIGGGTIVFSRGKTYRFANQGTTSTDDPASVTDFRYCLRINETDADIIIELEPGATIKRAAAEPENSTLILIGGKSTTRRMKKTAIIGYGTIDGNWTQNNTINTGFGFTDGGDICVIYNDNLAIDGPTFKDQAGMCLHVMRGSGKTRLSHLTFDLTNAMVTGKGCGTRLESNDITLSYSTFVCDALNGRPHLAYTDNADILFESRGISVDHCLFMGGYNGANVSFGGTSHCSMVSSVFKDVCHSSGIALNIVEYSNQNGSVFPSIADVVSDCAFHNIRQGISVGGNAATMSGVNWTMSVLAADIHDCVMTKDLDNTRNTLLAPIVSYPQSPPVSGPGSGAYGTRAPSASTVNFIVGIRVSFVSKRTGVSTGGGTTFLDDTNAALTGSALATDSHKNWFIYFKIGDVYYRSLITTNTASRITFAALPVSVPVGTAYNIGSMGCAGTRIHDCLFWLSNATGKAVEVLSPDPDIYVYSNSAYNVSVTPSTVVAFVLPASTKRWRNKGYSGDPFASGRIVYADEGSGTGTMVNGTTSVVITHALGRNPLPEEIDIRWMGNPNGASQPWISNITGNNQFTVNVANAPAGDSLFKYVVAPVD